MGDSIDGYLHHNESGFLWTQKSTPERHGVISSGGNYINLFPIFPPPRKKSPMKQRYFIEGSNFTASLKLDPELHGVNILCEAVTRVIEILFKPQSPPTKEEKWHIDLHSGEIAEFGPLVKVHSEKNPDKEYFVSTLVCVKNAGRTEMANEITKTMESPEFRKWVEEIIEEIKRKPEKE